MRQILTLALVVPAGGAQAHPGHIADVAGHDHWVIGAAIGAIVLAGVLGALKGKPKPEEAEPETETEGEPA